jgi:hypothetical protein
MAIHTPTPQQQNKKSTFPLTYLSWEVGREIENPNIPLTMYLDNPNSPNTNQFLSKHPQMWAFLPINIKPIASPRT